MNRTKKIENITQHSSFKKARKAFMKMFKDAKVKSFEESMEVTNDDYQQRYKNIRTPFSYKFPPDYESNKEFIADESTVFICKSMRIVYYYDQPGKQVYNCSRPPRKCNI